MILFTMLLVFSGLAAIGGGVCSCETRITVWRNLSAKSPDIGGVKSKNFDY
jgi:hypothetical protein